MAGEAWTPKVVKDLAEALGKVVGKEIAKHAAVSAYGGKYDEIPGRGGNANRSNLSGSGDIKGVREFEQKTKRLSDALDGVERGLAGFATGKLVGIVGGLINKIRPFRTTLDDVTRSAKDYAANQQGIYKKIADSAIEYVKAEGTRSGELARSAKKIQELRKAIHSLDGDLSKLSKKDKENLAVLDKKIKIGKRYVKLIDELSDEHKKAILAVREGKANPKQVKQATEALGKFSDVTEQAGISLMETSESMIGSMQNVVDAHIGRMFTALKIGFGSLAAGAMQLYTDGAFAIQAQVSEQRRTTALLMGMSNRELLRGMLEYRDTMRNLVVLNGSLKGLSDIPLRDIQNIGETFALRGDEAFRIGMQLHETSRLIGIAGEMSVNEMTAFYKDSAKALNMTVQDFGDYFNSLAKDPAFVSFSNTIRVTGGDFQSTLQKEISTRTRMNKILGQTNENLAEKLRMEHNEKYRDLTSRHKSRIGARLLTNLYEKEGVVSFTDEQRDIMNRGSFDYTSLNEKEREIFNTDIVGSMTLAPAQLKNILMARRDAADARGDEAEVQRITNKLGLVTDLMGRFGEMAGEKLYNTGQSEAAIGVLAGRGLSGAEAIQGLAAGLAREREQTDLPMDPQFKKFKDIVNVITGKPEEVSEPSNARIVFDKMLDIMEGVGKSGAAKALFGVVAASASVIYSFMKLSAILRMYRGGGMAGMFGRGRGGPKPPGGGGMFAKAGKLIKSPFAKAGAMVGTASASAGAAFSSIQNKIFKDKIMPKIVSNAAKSMSGTAAKGGMKSLVKKLPGIGLVFGGLFAAQRAMAGDIAGAAMELSSGAMSVVPGLGTAGSLAMDAAIIARDVNKQNAQDALAEHNRKMEEEKVLSADGELSSKGKTSVELLQETADNTAKTLKSVDKSVEASKEQAEISRTGLERAQQMAKDSRDQSRGWALSAEQSFASAAAQYK